MVKPDAFRRRIEEKVRDYRASGAIVIVAFGDSVTMGFTSAGGMEPDAVYHQRLKRMLEARYPAAVFSVINSGIGGDTATAALARLERDVLRYQPDLVLLAFGLNDASDEAEQLERYTKSLETIIAEVRARTPAEIILLTPTFMCSRESANVDPAHASILPRLMHLQNDGVLAKFAEAVREVAAERGVPVADVYAAWAKLAESGVDTTAMLANGLNHPTGEAHAIAAETIMKVITGD